MNAQAKARIDKARARVSDAQDELIKAGKALQAAIGATDEEISEAADALADVHHEADADGWAGAEWEQMVAEQVIFNRENEEMDKAETAR